MITGPAPAEMFDGIINIDLNIPHSFLWFSAVNILPRTIFPDTNNLPSKKLFSMATGASTQGRSGGCREGV